MFRFRTTKTNLRSSFSQVRSSRKTKIKKRIEIMREFVLFLIFYTIAKSKKLAKAISQILFLAPLAFTQTKNFITRKLIWGRGRLVRPFISFGVTCFIILVFLTGGFYQYKLVRAQTTESAFVSGVGFILPQRITATTVLPSGRVRDTELSYEVQSGDTLSSIGQEFGVTIETIRYANNITNPNSLKVGQALNIPPVSGVIHTVASGDTIDSIATKYSVASQAIADFNYLNEPFLLALGQKLIVPDAAIPVPVVIVKPTIVTSYDSSAYTNIPYAGSGKVGEGNFIWPTRNRTITQYFSWYHPAIDIAVMSPIYASDSGTVVRSGWWANGYGFAVQIDHNNGFVTTYAHMSSLYVSVGDEVGQGGEIGMMGSTGRSTGLHTHFTIQYNGRFQNPLDYL
ncbi:MAG: M23 family metallopeptidase [Patescibacteria group bacterium]|nr:M23 family metallopeptidase [Patescibacteria group bacterium]